MVGALLEEGDVLHVKERMTELRATRIQVLRLSESSGPRAKKSPPSSLSGVIASIVLGIDYDSPIPSNGTPDQEKLLERRRKVQEAARLILERRRQKQEQQEAAAASTPPTASDAT